MSVDGRGGPHGGVTRGAGASARAVPGPSADLRARVLAEVARTPAPTRSVQERRALAVTVAGAIATAVLFAMSGVERGTRPAELVAFTAGLGLLAALVLTRLSAGASGSMLGRPARVLVSAVAIATSASSRRVRRADARARSVALRGARRASSRQRSRSSHDHGRGPRGDGGRVGRDARVPALSSRSRSPLPRGSRRSRARARGRRRPRRTPSPLGPSRSVKHSKRAVASRCAAFEA
jgi:hypothetical protein